MVVHNGAHPAAEQGNELMSRMRIVTAYMLGLDTEALTFGKGLTSGVLKSDFILRDGKKDNYYGQRRG